MQPLWVGYQQHMNNLTGATLQMFRKPETTRAGLKEFRNLRTSKKLVKLQPIRMIA